MLGYMPKGLRSIAIARWTSVSISHPMERQSGEMHPSACSIWRLQFLEQSGCRVEPTGGRWMRVMNQIIVDAINSKRRISSTYNGKTRIAEPQCYGIGSKGTELLRVHQIRGGLQLEPLFDVSQMRDLVVLDQHFTKPGPNYRKNDSAMATIFAQL
jgi:hypothetical protein